MNLRRLVLAATAAFLVISSALGAPFTPGNLVIYRVGDGSATLGSGGTAVFLDEYTPAGVFVQSVAMPTTGASGRLVASGTATTEGFLSRSEDGRYLVVPGYDAALAATVTSSTTVPRVIGRVDGNGVLDASTSYVDATNAGNIRSATSVDGTRYWTSGSTQGQRTIVHGATTATVISTTNTNTRQINIFNDQLYISSGASTVYRMATIGTGLPTTAGQTAATLPGFPVTQTLNSFLFAHLDGGTGVDTLYVADEGNNQIQKWCLVSGSWVQRGSVPLATARGLTGVVNGTSVTLYATSGATGTPVLTITDSTGYNGTLAGAATTIISTAGTNKAFRAIAMAPTGGTVTTPGTPTGLTATAGNAHVALSWNAVSGATSYNVKRATVSGGPYATINSPNTNSYDDTSAVNGTTYFYVVSAANSAGESGNSSQVSATPTAPSTSPSGTGSANPSSVPAGNNTALTVNVTPGTNPTSTGIAVRADLSSIGGSNSQSFNDQGNNTWTFTATVNSNTTAGAKTLPVTITDAQNRTGTTSIALTVTVTSTPPTGVASANPNSVLPGATTAITVTVTPGTNPPSSGITVSGDLTGIGGSATQSFADNGDGTFSFTATVAGTTSVGAKSLPITIHDAQGRSSTTNASLTVLPPTTVKISQVYGGGGNSGSTYTNDFIEIYNSGSTPVSLDGWSVQATGVTATSWTANGAITLLSGTIQPGHYYLVQESQGAGGTTPLPTPDASGGILVSSTQGKVALVASTVALSGACPSGSSIVDLVGYGGANCSETSPTGALVNTTAALRRGNGCIDTNNNVADFIIAGPIPRNSASPVNSCGGDASQPSGFGSASPNAIEPASNTLLTVQVTPATLPPSTALGVVGDLTSIGGPASQQFYDDGTNGDQTSGDNVFSFQAVVDRLSTTGAKSMLATISDGQGRTATAPITLTVVSPTCGVERWSVKVGVDPDAPQVDVNNPVVTTIANLRSFPAPADPPGPPDNARVFPWEGTAYTVSGTMTLYKKEADVDYHIVIQDEHGNTMVTEIPSPACIITSGTPRVPAPSPFTPGISIARGKFDARFTATTFFQSANIPVRMTGVAFFDFIHGQTGVAPNGIELHPLLDITFTTPTTTTLASSLNPSPFGSQVSITAAVSGGTGTPTGNVTFFDGGNSVATRLLDNSGQATYITSGLSVGSHSLTASYEGDATFAPSTSSAMVQVVNKADQTITFAALANKTYGDAPFTVSALGGGSTSPVTFAAAGNCTSSGTNGSTITITGAGNCTVTASQAGDGNYNAAADVARSFAIAPATANVVVTGYSGVYDGHAHGATGSALGINGEDLTNLLDFGASFTDVPGGTAHWTFSGNANYAPTAGDAAIVIAQASASITVNGYTGVYDGHAHDATGSATGVNGESLSSLLNLGASFTNVPGGTAHWTFAGNTNYAPASGDASITITQATATVSVNGYTGVYDGHAHGATGSAHGVTGEDLSSLLDLGATFTDVPGGTAHWSFAGNVNYAPASGDASITITQATATVSVNGYTGVYDGHAHGATGSAHGATGEDLSSLLDLGATFTDVPGGTAHWSFAGNVNYVPASGDAAISISQAAATININGFTGAYDGHPHGATGSATGVNGENLNGLLNLGASFTNVPGGTAHWTFAGNTNYAPAAGDAAITITQAAATIQVNGYSGVYDGAAHGATGSATGVNGENLTPLLGLGASFTNVPGGTANWTFAGNLNYAPASGSVHIIINPAIPVVTVSGLTSTGGIPIYDGTPKTASATATGIGGVTVAGTFIFTYNGSLTPPTLPGTYAVVASFTSANPNYASTTGTGTLTIGGLRDDLQNQLTAIANLRNTTTNKQDLDRLNAAITHLGEALDPDQWLDSIHGTTADGDGIFTEGKNALIPLLAMVKDPNCTIAPSLLQPIINRIVTDLRQLALTAINDAAAHGANVDKARTELGKGDSDITNGQYESGIEHYRSAWNIATKA